MDKIIAIVFAAVVIASASNARAQTPHQWSGTTAIFNDANNWTPATLPDATSALVFPSVFTQLPNNDMTALTVYSIAFDAPGTNIAYILSGNALTITNGITQTRPAGVTDVITAPIILGAPQTFNSATGLTLGALDLAAHTCTVVGPVTFSGVVSGTGGVTLSSGTLAYTGAANTYTGATTVSGGTLELRKAAGTNAIVGPITIAAGATLLWFADNQVGNVAVTIDGTLKTTNFDDTIGSITGAGTIDLTGVAADNPTLVVGADNGSTTFTGPLVGGGTLRKGGTGTLTIPTASASTTVLSVSAGTLVVDGNRTAATTISGGTLTGSATFGAVTGTGGTIAPGGVAATGIMNTGNLRVGTNTSLAIQLNGTTAGTGHDQVVVTGTVNVTGGTLTLSSTGVTAAPGVSVTIISNDGADAVTGTFDGLAEGISLMVGGWQWLISYKGGDGNDVTLTVALNSPIPDMATSGGTTDGGTTAGGDGGGMSDVDMALPFESQEIGCTTVTPRIDWMWGWLVIALAFGAFALLRWRGTRR